MADLRIADARPADVDQIHALERASFPSPWRREFFESELRAEGRYNRVIRSDRMIVAYNFAMHFMDEMHINKIAVARSFRRRGLARSLMDDALSFAREHDIRLIALEVRESNQPAQAFYSSLSFDIAYIRARYYPDGESAVVMTLEM
ncbi:MAG TPA: ribosomal protein S18-alanine N-acetyltransferase [Thermoanaerobaculia bacterium]|nr:ribosomal protein S18-alanine N-acetyltransferase [Thermoanaerobaculia bacterium]